LVKLADEALARLLPGRPAGEALGVLRAWNPQAFVLYTCGGAGMRLLTPTATHDRPAFPVTMADPVGAGDACLGGWIASWLTRPAAPPTAHLDFAAATAAAAGAYAPTREEVEAVLAR